MAMRRCLSRPVLVPALCVFLGLVACADQKETVTPEPRPVLVAIANGAASHASGYAGTVRAQNRAVMAVTVPGRVTRVHVDLGEPVRRGQALLSLDTTALDAAVRAAESTLAEAQAAAFEATQRAERADAAAASGAASPTEVDALTAAAKVATAQVSAAQSALMEARWQRDESQLRAPIDGVVAARHVEPGQALGAGMPTLEIDGQGREIVVDLPANLGITVGEVVDLEGPAGADEGKVLRLNERLDAAAIRRAIIAAPPEARVGDVWSIRPRVAQGVVYVPMRAIQRHSDAGSAFVLKLADEAGTITVVPVKTGAPHGASIEVVDGLSNGDRIVIAGAASLREGDRVEPITRLR